MANLIRRKETGATEPARVFDPFEAMRDLMRWDPFAELAPGAPGVAFVPSFDVKETGEAYVFTADLPGGQSPIDLPDPRARPSVVPRGTAWPSSSGGRSWCR